MSTIKMSEKRRTLCSEVGEDFYTVATQATRLAAIERYFILDLLRVSWCNESELGLSRSGVG